MYFECKSEDRKNRDKAQTEMVGKCKGRFTRSEMKR